MRILGLNQYGPPDPAPTARLLGELAEFLRGAGHEVQLVSAASGEGGAGGYRAGGGGNGRNARAARGGGRMRRELGALWAIWRAGAAVRPRPEVVLALSSPPCLLLVAAALAGWHRARLAHWAMDLYPELALALGELRGPGALFRVLRAGMGWAYRRAALVVALDEDMRAHLRATYGVDAQVLAPWASTQLEGVGAGEEGFDIPQGDREDAGAGWAAGSETPWTWLYSGNLGRAHEWETLLDAQRRLEERGLPIQLVFQGGGNERPAARARAEAFGLRRCQWRDYVAEDALVDHLLAAGALIVTQRPAARGLLWPSKLALVERLPRPILWVGPKDGAIAHRLAAGRGEDGGGSDSGVGIFAPGEGEAVAGWVEARFRSPGSAVVPALAAGAGGGAEAGCRALEAWLREGAPV